MDFAITSTR